MHPARMAEAAPQRNALRRSCVRFVNYHAFGMIAKLASNGRVEQATFHHAYRFWKDGTQRSAMLRFFRKLPPLPRQSQRHQLLWIDTQLGEFSGLNVRT
jgi:hypothetical protein